MSQSPRIVETADGSFTCFDPMTGELYHNRAGAIAEALTHFVKPLQLERLSGELTVLDLPFGLGYNSFVLLENVLRSADSRLQKIEIVAVEKDESVLELVDLVLNNPQLNLLRQALGAARDEFVAAIRSFRPISLLLKKDDESMPPSKSSQTGCLELRFQLKHGDIRHIVPELAGSDLKFDVIMHDAFSANKMPELWTTELFGLYRQMIRDNGRLATYSVAVAVRAGMLQAGFRVYSTSPLGAKSGGTMATPEELEKLEAFGDDIFQLTNADIERLASRSGVPYRDPGFNCSAAEIRKLRAKEQSE